MSVDGDAIAASTQDRVVAAALRCLAAEGLRRTTVDDVAVESGISRATLYRAFPGGRDTIVAAVVDAELERLTTTIERAVAPVRDLRGALVSTINAAAVWLTANEAIATLMFVEPALLLTHLEFEQMDRTLEVASSRLAPLLDRFLDPTTAARVGEWVARLVVSYLLFPSDEIDLCDPVGAEVLVDRHVLPALAALRAGVPG
jgi:AcrR family transcriptional regulator